MDRSRPYRESSNNAISVSTQPKQSQRPQHRPSSPQKSSTGNRPKRSIYASEDLAEAYELPQEKHTEYTFAQATPSTGRASRHSIGTSRNSGARLDGSSTSDKIPNSGPSIYTDTTAGETEKLISMISMLQQDKNELLNKVANLKNELEEQISFNKKQKEENKRLNNRNEELNRKLEQMEPTESGGGPTDDIMQRKAKATSLDKRKLMDTLDGLKQAVAETKQYYDSELKSLSKELHQKQKENKELRSRLDTQDSDTPRKRLRRSPSSQNVESKSPGTPKEISTERAKRAQTQKLLDELVTVLKRYQDDLQGAKIAVSESKKDVWYLSQHVQDLKTETAEKDEAVRKSAEVISSMRLRLHRQDDSKKSIAAELAGVDTSSDTVKMPAAAFEKMRSFLEDYNRDESMSIDSILNEHVNILRTQIDNYRKDSELDFAELTRLTEELVCKVDEVNMLHDGIRSLEQEVATHRADKHALVKLLSDIKELPMEEITRKWREQADDLLSGSSETDRDHGHVNGGKSVSAPLDDVDAAVRDSQTYSNSDENDKDNRGVKNDERSTEGPKTEGGKLLQQLLGSSSEPATYRYGLEPKEADEVAVKQDHVYEMSQNVADAAISSALQTLQDTCNR